MILILSPGSQSQSQHQPGVHKERALLSSRLAKGEGRELQFLSACGSQETRRIFLFMKHDLFDEVKRVVFCCKCHSMMVFQVIFPNS